ncbi:GAF and ANTAR domain-containing protein [Catellatospora sp. NPDC049609]|uniref:GAF and ANTAR domain-containing protein n=1 Tax=Catellatospora sp. NPDC049609 TaxID=3155505 RepID=UPI003438ED4B
MSESLAESFVELADTLVDDFDLMEFLYRVTVTCSAVLGVAAAGVLLSDQRGALRVAAASSERSLELLQRQTGEGPSPECFRTGRPTVVADLAVAADHWPRFVTLARGSGFASVYALPMRLRTELIGVLTLFGTRPAALDPGTVQLGQALADMATIGLLQTRTIPHRETLVEQLQTAINSRIVIEQAKGVLAERHRLDMDGSFALLRDTARRHNRRLSELARAVVDGSAAVI